MKVVDQKKTSATIAKVGQVYKDCDPRVKDRKIKVLSIGKTHAEVENVATGRKGKILLAEFHTNPKKRGGYVAVTP